MKNYWALAANPKNYRIEDAVKELDQDTWVTKGSNITRGDRVIIWKTKADGEYRGIISLGEVVSDVIIGTDVNNPYWNNLEMANKSDSRVVVRYIASPNLPLWIGDDRGDFLQELSVAKAQGGTVFKVTPEQWDEIMEAVGGWPNGDGISLMKYSDYSRKEVHYMFSPETEFTPQAGTWGLQGIIPIPNHPNDFVFFVTLGKQQGDHVFDEGITDNGVLTWQSQPRQSLQTDQILQFIRHDELKNNIYLFFRISGDRDYTYLGKLKYLSHDKERENPVHFQWQILDWEPGNTPERIGLQLQQSAQDLIVANPAKRDTLEYDDPPQKIKRTGISTPSFRSKKGGDFSEKNSRNRELGLLGEELVMKIESETLISNGKPELAKKIRHISKKLGDGAGYDIKSYTLNGDIKYIEVKTTTGSKETPFFMSSNEKAFAEINKENYYIYRVFAYDKETNAGKCFVLNGSLKEKLVFSPTQFKVSFVDETE